MLSTRLAFALLLTALAVPAAAQDVSYELVNQSGLTLMEFHATPIDLGVESEDLLSAAVLPNGESGSVVIPDGGSHCDHELRFTFEDGSDMTDTVNVCDTVSYTLSPG